MRLRTELTRRFIDARPDVFVGIDAPEFNLGLARRLRERGHPHGAVRQPAGVGLAARTRARHRSRGRPRAVPAAVRSRVLSQRTAVRAEFVGHPLADQIPLWPDRAGARSRLGLTERPTVARAARQPHRRSDPARRAFAQTIAWLNERRPDLQFVAPMASGPVREKFELALQRHAAAIPVRLSDGDAQSALAAADVAIVASGTATLETLLCKRPMVVAYRLGALTAWLVRTFELVKVPYFSQPNLLAGRQVVPRIFQEAVTPEALGSADSAPAGRRGGASGDRAVVHRDPPPDAPGRERAGRAGRAEPAAGRGRASQ